MQWSEQNASTTPSGRKRCAHASPSPAPVHDRQQGLHPTLHRPPTYPGQTTTTTATRPTFVATTFRSGRRGLDLNHHHQPAQDNRRSHASNGRRGHQQIWTPGPRSTTGCPLEPIKLTAAKLVALLYHFHNLSHTLVHNVLSISCNNKQLI